MQVSPIKSNMHNFIKTNITKKTAKKNAVLLSAGSLAAILPAKDFLNKTKTDKVELSGRWEYYKPMDSSDYPHRSWVEDKHESYISGSCPENYADDNDSSNDSRYSN